MMLPGILALLSALLGLFAGPVSAVFGGYEANIKDYPHHAAIQESTYLLGSRFIASGAILSPQIIVTVASSVSRYRYRPNKLLVRVGSQQTGYGGVQHNVAELHQYPTQPNYFDVAVLKLSKPITWSQNVNSINLPRVNDRPQYGDTAFVSSWGSYEDGYYATKLRHASMTVLNGCYPYTHDSGSKKNISETYQSSSMLCLSSKSAQGTCTNDDGAPLVSKGVLAGLATRWGFGCNNPYGESSFVDLSNWEVRYFLEGFL